MILKELTELNWRWYEKGRPQANNQSLHKQDFSQKIKVLFSDLMRQRYYQSKQADQFNQPDYAFVSPILNVKRFELSDPDINGKRRADMSAWDLYRLPKNSHFQNVNPVAAGCGNQQLGDITQVAPGEENFYVNNADMKSIGFMFFLPKGRGIDTYNIPPCVKQVDIETTYDIGDNTDIDMSIASVITDQILNVSLGINKQFYSEAVQKEMMDQNVIK